MIVRPNVFYTFANRNSELFMSVAGGSKADGAPLIQWPQDGTESQIFLVAQPEVDYQIMPLTTLLALGIQDGSRTPGANVVQWTPDYSTNQRFVFTPAEEGYFAITSPDTGLVLGVPDGSTDPGIGVVQWTRQEGVLNQLFSVLNAGGGYFNFRNQGSGLLLAIAGGSTSPGASLIQWTDDGSDSQKFLLVGGPDASVMIVPKSSVKVLGIAGGSTTQGANVVQFHPDGSPDQRFGFGDAGAGLITITSPPTGFVLGVDGGSKEAQAQIVQWPSTGALDQRFLPTPVSLGVEPLGAADLAPGTPLFEAMRRFAPEVRLHPLEQYFPDTVANFLGHAQVRNSANTVLQGHVSAAALVPYGAWGTAPDRDQKEAYYVSPARDWTDPILVGRIPTGRVPITSGLYKGGYAGGLVDVPMPARGFAVNGTYWFDYVFFYPYNGEQVLQAEYLTFDPLLEVVTGHVTVDPMATHIGDWEHAQVRVSGDLRRIIEIRLFNHGDPTVIRNSPADPQWKDVAFVNGTHPVMYSGLHSHATYATRGNHLQSLGNAVNIALKLTPDIKSLNTTDWCDDGGAVWQAWTQLAPFGVEANGTRLPGFPGTEWVEFYPHRWGRSRTFSVSTNVTIEDLADGVSTFAATEILVGITAGLAAGVDQLTDGLGVSPPDWWRSGY